MYWNDSSPLLSVVHVLSSTLLMIACVHRCCNWLCWSRLVRPVSFQTLLLAFATAEKDGNKCFLTVLPGGTAQITGSFWWTCPSSIQNSTAEPLDSLEGSFKCFKYRQNIKDYVLLMMVSAFVKKVYFIADHCLWSCCLCSCCSSLLYICS